MPFLRAFHCALLSLTVAGSLFAALPREKAASDSDPLKPAVSSPAPVLHLTLSQAIRMALEKNLAIKVDAFEPDIARARVTSEEGVFDPEWMASAEQGMTRYGDNSENRQGAFGVGVGGLTPLGTTYTFGMNTTSFDYRSYSSGASIGLTQPLLRGFGTDVNLANLRIARTNQQGSEEAFRAQVITVVTQTIFVYNELYAAKRKYEAAVRWRDSALQLERDERRRAEIGVRIALDVTTARAEAASREEAVLLAQSSIDDNERFLKQLVSGDIATLLKTRVVIEPPPTPSVGTVAVEQGLRDALDERPDYRQALLDLRIRNINVVTSRNAALPRLDLTGSLNLLGLTQADAVSSFGFFDNTGAAPNSWSAGVVFRIPIPNRNARGKATAARLLKAQALVSLQQMEQQIIVEVANAAGQIDTSRKRIDTTREALRLSRESLAAGEERLKAGSATPFEVLELQRSLAQAEAAVIQAEGDYRNAVSEYDRRTGMTLVRNGVTVAR